MHSTLYALRKQLLAAGFALVLVGNDGMFDGGTMGCQDAWDFMDMHAP